MSWIGKIVGGSIGFTFGGPLGAVAGAAIGHGLDMMADQDVQRPAHGHPAGLDALQEAQSLFFVTTFSLLAKMAKADGVVTRDEVQVVDDFIKRNLESRGPTRDLAIRIFREAKNSPYTFESFAEQFHDAFRHQPSMLREMLELLYRVAMADGVLHPEEERLLKAAERIFGIESGDVGRIRARLVLDDSRHYAVLECDPSDSLKTIKSRYRQLARDYHPDRLMAKGLPEEMLQVGTRKLQEINQAYDAIVVARAGN